MPTYEMPIILRIMSRPEIVDTLKRAAQAIFQRGGIIRKLENLGTKDTPYKLSAHDRVNKRASYFLFQFDAPPACLEDLKEEYSRDVDIIRTRIFRMEEPPTIECTLAEELLPAAYRKDVMKLVELGKKKHKPKFKDNMGIGFYPFQR